MEIESISVKKIVPYPNNPRKNDDSVQYVAESIKEFGFKVPIVIDKNNVIVAGHTRLKAAESLGLKEVPCIRASDLSEEQVRAFRIADNKVSEHSKWDLGKLELELEDITIDMSAFGLEIKDVEIEAPDSYYGDERERTNKEYNLDLLNDVEHTNDFWQMPIIKNNGFVPKDIVGFNYALSNSEKNVGIHFYVDDYQFERVWNDPQKYVDVLKEYECIFSPDFFLYMDMTMPMKIWNIYRSRLIGAFYQSHGIKVIPTISWAEKETFKFCFEGIPEGSIVSVSTIGVKEEKDAMKVWKDGMDAMISAIKPKTILVYGGKIEYNYNGIEVIYYSNKVLDRWKGEDNANS
jgi:hypothetical protein